MRSPRRIVFEVRRRAVHPRRRAPRARTGAGGKLPPVEHDRALPRAVAVRLSLPVMRACGSRRGRPAPLSRPRPRGRAGPHALSRPSRPIEVVGRESLQRLGFRSCTGLGSMSASTTRRRSSSRREDGIVASPVDAIHTSLLTGACAPTMMSTGEVCQLQRRPKLWAPGIAVVTSASLATRRASGASEAISSTTTLRLRPLDSKRPRASRSGSARTAARWRS